MVIFTGFAISLSHVCSDALVLTTSGVLSQRVHISSCIYGRRAGCCARNCGVRCAGMRPFMKLTSSSLVLGFKITDSSSRWWEGELIWQ